MRLSLNAHVFRRASTHFFFFASSTQSTGNEITSNLDSEQSSYTTRLLWPASYARGPAWVLMFKVAAE